MSTAQVRAWTYTSGGYPSSLRLSTVRPPSKIDVKPNHILVQIKSAALNPVDIQIMNLPFWSIPLPTFTAEKTIGSDFSGIVLHGGEGSGFAQGDEIFGVTMKPFNPCGGTISETAYIDLASACVTKKPAEWTWNQAGGLGCVFLTARTSIESVAPYVDSAISSAQKRVVILGGSSACGIYGVQLAKKRGWKVMTTCSARNSDFLRELGADDVIDYNDRDVRYEVKRCLPAAVIDNVGGTDCVDLGKRYVTIVGDKTTRTKMGGPLTYYLSFKPRQWIRWALGRLGLGHSYDVIMLDLKKEYLDEAKELPPERIIIDSIFSLDDVKNAYERLNTGRARGKIMIEVS